MRKVELLPTRDCEAGCGPGSTHFRAYLGKKGVFGWEVYIQAKMGLSVSIFLSFTHKFGWER